MSLSLVLTGNEANKIQPEWIDHQSAHNQVAVHDYTDVLEKVPPASKNGAQANRGSRSEMRWTAVAPVNMCDAVSKKSLLTITPRIVYPGFIFDLLHTQNTYFRDVTWDNFVETGTLFGHTAIHASYWFKNVFSIELSPELHQQAVDNLRHRDNVTCLYGDSASVLASLLPTIKGASVFFLDAHWSGDNSVDWSTSKFGGYPVETQKLSNTDLAEADRQVPLEGELKSIAREHRGRAMVIIDDWQSLGNCNFAFAGEDWRNVDKNTLVEWFECHPRTLFHHRLDEKRYVWGIDAF